MVVKITQDILIGCLLAIGGNLLISISLNVTKLTHMKNAKRDTPRHYLRDPLWWVGMLLMCVGELSNFTAYGFAPVSLVAPLGTVTVVANMFLSFIILHEKVTIEQIFGSGLAVNGAVLIVLFSTQEEKVLDAEEIQVLVSQTAFIVYIVIESIVLGILMLLLYVKGIKHVLIYLLITAILASITVISAKAVSGMVQLTFIGISQFIRPVFYIMLVILIVTAVLQIKYLNLAIKYNNASIVVPTNFVFFTISAILAGIVFYQELWGMSVLRIIVFMFGCVMCFFGVFFVAIDKKDFIRGINQLDKRKHISDESLEGWPETPMDLKLVQPGSSDDIYMDEFPQYNSIHDINQNETGTSPQAQRQDSASK